MTRLKKKEFETEIVSVIDKINEVLDNSPPGDLAMLALAVALGERIADENDSPEERKACFSVMMKIVLAGVEEEPPYEHRKERR